MFDPKVKILVVDDVEAMRGMVRNALDRLQYKNITEAENGEEAWKQLIDADLEGKPFQLVISDWNMPHMTGLELLALLRDHPKFKNLPFVMVTTEGEEGNVLRALKAGASHYIVKPVTTESLQPRLLIVYERHFSKKAA